jgi:hypothetical protein
VSSVDLVKIYTFCRIRARFRHYLLSDRPEGAAQSCDRNSQQVHVALHETQKITYSQRLRIKSICYY